MAQNTIEGALQRIAERLQYTRPAAAATQSIAMWRPSTPRSNLLHEQHMNIPQRQPDGSGFDESTLTDDKLEFMQDVLQFLRGIVDEPVYPGLSEYFQSNLDDAEVSALLEMQDTLETIQSETGSLSNGETLHRYRTASPFRASLRSNYESVIMNILELAHRIPVSRADSARTTRYTLSEHSLSFLMRGQTCQAAWGHFGAAHDDFDILLRLDPRERSRAGLPVDDNRYELLVITTPGDY